MMLQKINSENQLGVAMWLAKNTKLPPIRINELCPEIHEFKIIILRNGKVNLPDESDINPITYGFCTEDDLLEVKKESESKAIYNKIVEKQKRYIPHNLRQYIPSCILWITKHHPEITAKAIAKLFGKTPKYVQDIMKSTLEIPLINPVSIKLVTKEMLNEITNS